MGVFFIIYVVYYGVFCNVSNYYLTKPVELTAAQPFQEEGGNIIIPLDVDDYYCTDSYKKDDTI